MIPFGTPIQFLWFGAELTGRVIEAIEPTTGDLIVYRVLFDGTGEIHNVFSTRIRSID